MKQKVIVTGGAGFIGSNLATRLVTLGYDVHIIDNLSGGEKERVPAGAHLHIADIRKINEIEPHFASAAVIFHLAALPRVQYSIEHPEETHEVNVTGTLNVLMASAKHKVGKVIYSASSSAYGDQDILPIVESMPARPKSPYGAQKYIGEVYCKVWAEVFKLKTVSLRYFNVYGPGQSHEGDYALVIAKFLKQKKDGGPMTITGDGKQTRDFTHVRDVVNANILAFTSDKVGAGEVINIGSGDNYSVNKVAELIGGEVIHIPARLEPKDTRADNSLARKLLGWKPTVTLAEGIKELL